MTHVELKSVHTGLHYVPFVVRIPGGHLERRVVDRLFAYFRSSRQRTDERVVPAAGSDAEFHFSDIHVALPRKHKRVLVRCHKGCRGIYVPALGCGIPDHIKYRGLYRKVFFYYHQVFRPLAAPERQEQEEGQ